MTEESVDDGDVEATIGFLGALGDALSDLPAAVVRGPFVYDVDFWLGRVLLWPLLKPFYIMFAISTDEEHKKRVNTFYPETWVDASWALAAVAITVAFGGIHLIGWTFTFPSSAERTLWRVASLSITAFLVTIPPLVAFGWAIDTFLLDVDDDESGFCSKFAMILPLVLYILSRLALLVLPFLCLRSLPPAAFHMVHWTSFIPHV